MKEIAYGYCRCGCGAKTNIAKYDIPRKGIKKGQPAIYIHGHNRRRNVEDRFFEKVAKTESCWIWEGCKDKKGYGQVQGFSNVTYAHRLSWQIHFGQIPNGLFVLHRCDNPSCCNPEHLFLGTNQDNVNDMVAKGRAAMGSQNGQSKLTESMVKIIREESSATRQSDLGSRFGLDQSTISRIVNYKSWRHL